MYIYICTYMYICAYVYVYITYTYFSWPYTVRSLQLIYQRTFFTHMASPHKLNAPYKDTRE